MIFTDTHIHLYADDFLTDRDLLIKEAIGKGVQRFFLPNIDSTSINAMMDVQKHFPQAPELAPGSVLYALHAADGTPIMLTDSREAAVANAWSNELETVSVH